MWKIKSVLTFFLLVILSLVRNIYNFESRIHLHITQIGNTLKIICHNFLFTHYPFF